jgi:hypothetical protein
VPETGSNVEIAQQMHEHGHAAGRKRLWIEIGEAVLLALVAVATAWSGYQSAQWDGHEAEQYATSAHLRFDANALESRAGEEEAYDATTLNSWLQAKLSHEDKLAAFYARRFLPYYETAFVAWLKTDPLNNPAAPAGPIFMPQYHNPKREKAADLNIRATEAFEDGTAGRKNADHYVRATVLLATVLFLIAISQRFDVRRVRESLLVLAVILLVISLYEIVTLPRL